MLHAEMGRVTVHVTPRSGRTAVEATAEGVVVRVRAAPEGGKATDEARRALATALGVPATSVSVRSGARSRTKVFEVEGLTSVDIGMRLRTT